MKKILTVCVLFASGLSLSGCIQNNEQGGALAGGVVGGIVGNQFGSGSGRAAATIAGTLVGAWAGSQWGKSLDERSRRRAMAAEQRALYSGHVERWESDRYRGEVIPERNYYYSEGRKCRRYRSVIWIDGQPKNAYGRACKVGDRWQVVS